LESQGRAGGRANAYRFLIQPGQDREKDRSQISAVVLTAPKRYGWSLPSMTAQPPNAASTFNLPQPSHQYNIKRLVC